MRSVWFLAGALALCASAALAAEDHGLLIFTKRADEKALRAALPSGNPSIDVLLDCVAGVGRYDNCAVTSTDPGPAVAAAAVKVALDYRFESKDRDRALATGRHFEEEIELLAPGDKNNDWLRKPTGESLAAVFPVKALRAGQSGSASISCRVTVEGYLDRCKAVAENPAGYDFGAAALQLSQQFRMTPRMRAGRPVDGSVRIPIVWPEVPRVNGPPPKERVLADPTWTVVPLVAAVKAAYPEKAAGVPAGQAAIRCDLTDKGQATRCEITSEIPPGLGFGAAARTLASNFVVAYAPEQAVLLKRLQVDIPFRFRNPTSPDNGRLTEPRWTRTLSPAGSDLLFPKAAIAAKVWKGSGTVDCAAAANGTLVDCKLIREEPIGLGFGPAAMEAAKVMRMNLWTKTGDPVEGRRLTLPLRFEAPPPAETPAAP